MLLVLVPPFSSAMETVTLRFTTMMESEQHVVVSVKITCAEKSMSLGRCSLHPVSLFKKSSRLPEDKTEQETMSVSVPTWALVDCVLINVHVSCVFNRQKHFWNVQFFRKYFKDLFHTLLYLTISIYPPL